MTTEAEAGDKVADFLNVEDGPKTKDQLVAEIGSPSMEEHPNLGRIYVFRGEFGEAWVSATGGNVISFTGPRRFTPAEAEEFARSFLGRHIDDFDKRNFRRVSTEMTDPLWKEEWEEQPRKPEEVSIFENWATVQVNVEGRRLHYLNWSDLRHVRTDPPRVDEASARKKVAEAFPSGEILSLRLVEHTDDAGASWMTLWHAEVSSDEDADSPTKLLSINADSGEIVPQ